MRTTFRILGIGVLLILIAVGVMAVIGLLTGLGPLAATYTKADGSAVPLGELLFFCTAIFAVFVVLPTTAMGRLTRSWLPQLPCGLLTTLRAITIAVLFIPIAFAVATLARAIFDANPHDWTFIVTEAVMILLLVILPSMGIGQMIIEIIISGVESETAAS